MFLWASEHTIPAVWLLAFVSSESRRKNTCPAHNGTYEENDQIKKKCPDSNLFLFGLFLA